MLKLKHIRKEYKTGELLQKALDDVSLSLRDNEFVAILGPSGSGKTTLLNIIGGLDRYDSGEMIINGISTQKYSDRDWDSYRNHTVGFVFQSYNLIPHQTILSNVELALTISGVSGAERRRRAAEALQKVGLGDQLHKRPSEMSGGQMQRVAIARALVNNPDILLADEPTGALDSETSVQVMELLKEVAKDRLVVMVTHNPDLAEQYATRIVTVKDGIIQSDTDPFRPDESQLEPPVHMNMGRSSMSLFTSLVLSFNNLRTKKARTLLTAFAGSIGIIGIALIISLSAGVNDYIADMERSTLSEYPLQILSNGIDITSMLSSSPLGQGVVGSQNAPEEGMVTVRELITPLVSGISSNDLASLKAYLESDAASAAQHASSIEYLYGVSPQIYQIREDGSYRQVNPDSTLAALGLSGVSSTNEVVSSMMDTSVFYSLPRNEGLYDTQYDVKAGRWPEHYNECVVVLAADGSVTDYALYSMGLRDSAELDKMVQQFAQNQNVDLPEDFHAYRYEDFLNIRFKLANPAQRYVYDDAHSVWVDKSDDKPFMQELLANSEDLTVVGVVQPKANASATMLGSGIAYSPELVPHMADFASNSEIVHQQMAQPEVNVLTGQPFGAEEKAPALELNKLFSVDTDRLQQAFQFNPNALDLSGVFDLNSGALDLEGLVDFSSLQLDFSQLPGLDPDTIGALMESLSLSIPAEKVQALAQKVLNGYKDYVIGNGFLHLNRLDFGSYLQTPQFQQLMKEAMEELIDKQAVSQQLSTALQQALAGYSAQLNQVLQTQLGSVLQQVMSQAMPKIMAALQTQLQKGLSNLASQMENAIKIDASAFKDAISLSMDETQISELLTSAMLSSSATYDSNLQNFGYVDFSRPSQIRIYPLDFESKAVILEELETYNNAMTAQGEEEKVIRYTDLVGTLMTSVTEIVNMISSMLVAFVSISLVVSSIMIGVITYISVLERRKEIGILRAIGASKRNVSEVFNAETLIIGLFSGILGIILSELLLIPGNMLIRSVSGSSQMTAVLPLDAAVILVLLSTLLTILGGLIPSMSAAKCNPVTALRSE